MLFFKALCFVIFKFKQFSFVFLFLTLASLLVQKVPCQPFLRNTRHNNTGWHSGMKCKYIYRSEYHIYDVVAKTNMKNCPFIGKPENLGESHTDMKFVKSFTQANFLTSRNLPEKSA